MPHPLRLPHPGASASTLALCAALIGLCAGCVRDADTVLEPDPAADGGPGGDGSVADVAPVEVLPPRIEVDPASLDLPGAGAVAQVRIANVGEGPLHIQRISRRGDPGFAAVHGGRNVLLLTPAELSGEQGLMPGSALVVTVEALVGPPARATLVIESDDPEQPVVEVPLGFPDAPCLRAQPMAVDFGDVALGQGAQEAVRLHNCGVAPLDLTRIVLQDGGSEHFELVEDGLPALARLPSEGFIDVPVRFTARVAGPSRAVLEVAADGAVARVPLTARAVAPQCPVAVAAAPIERRAELFEVVLLDGSGSVDPDGPMGRPIEWRWTVVDRPAGSTSMLHESLLDEDAPLQGGPHDDVGTPEVLFVPDRRGRFAFELTVSDAAGCTDTALVTLDVCPCAGDGIAVELDWTTPGDDDPDDNFGADLDLHLLHPNAEGWFSRPYDCHFAEPTPDWGQLDQPADDPVLDVDAVGSGPERIVLGIPENTDILGAPYLVGVDLHDFVLDPEGPAIPMRGQPATVRIFVGGALLFEQTETLGQGAVFWDVASIAWPGAEVVRRDRLYGERP